MEIFKKNKENQYFKVGIREMAKVRINKAKKEN